MADIPVKVSENVGHYYRVIAISSLNFAYMCQPQAKEPIQEAMASSDYIIFGWLALKGPDKIQLKALLWIKDRYEVVLGRWEFASADKRIISGFFADKISQSFQAKMEEIQ